MIIYIAQCKVGSPGFSSPVERLDAELGGLYPSGSNHLDAIRDLDAADAFAVGAFDLIEQVGCGAFKRMTNDGVYAEIKRIYVEPLYRGAGIARRILDALEDEMRRRGLTVARLETGVAAAEPPALYEKAGYRRRGPFGGYRDDIHSAFFEKQLGLQC
ncbi:MAG: GNAT family N-acetyltransferase [Gammaproteobacteria bacterium]|nr:GNAT family N-acetyltransferase [Gammaproteobacteria bacterium]